jgi:hypothetical protein
VARRLTGSSEAGSRWLKSLSKRQRLEMDRRLKGPSGHLLSSGGKRIGEFAVSSVWTLPVQIIKPKESKPKYQAIPRKSRLRVQPISASHKECKFLALAICMPFVTDSAMRAFNKIQRKDLPLILEKELSDETPHRGCKKRSKPRHPWYRNDGFAKANYFCLVWKEVGTILFKLITAYITTDRVLATSSDSSCARMYRLPSATAGAGGSVHN